MTVKIIVGDCRAVLRSLSPESIHCVVTSPPYWGLRDYGTGTWEGGDPACEHRSPTMREGRNEDRDKLDGSASTNSAQLLLAHRSACGKCGAVKVDRQLGLDPTLGEHIAAMVSVFDEVWRVLRKDGTVWLNYGDCYATAPNGRSAADTKTTGNDDRTFRDKPFSTVGGDLKAKDLAMVPNRLAIELQRRRYTGHIKDELDRVWLAAMIDGEGCFYIHRRKAGTDSGARYTRANGDAVSYARVEDTYSPAVEVANTCEAVVRRCHAIAGCGSVSRQDKDRRQPIYRWTARSIEAQRIAREVYPYLVAKRQQCRIIGGAPNAGPKAAAAHGALKALHAGQEIAVDYAAPAPCWRPGWYVRSEIVWAKPNPMPESIKDRPGVSHEKIWLLTKAERYFYDAAAVRQPITESSAERLGQPGLPDQEGSARANVGSRAHRPMKAVRFGGDKGGGDFGASARTKSGNEWRPRATPPRHADHENSDRSGLDEVGRGQRNLRNVWTIPTAAFAEAHFATFPPALVEPCIKAGTSEHGVCNACGAPWVRQTETVNGKSYHDHKHDKTRGGGGQGGSARKKGYLAALDKPPQTTVWAPSCKCEQTYPLGRAVVLDPFGGSGTVGMVASGHGRDAILAELNPAYAELAAKRIGLFAQIIPLDPYADGWPDAEANSRGCYDVALAALRDRNKP